MASHFLGPILALIFWMTVLPLCLWLVRKFAPSWERTLFDPLSVTLRKLWRRLRAGRNRA